MQWNDLGEFLAMGGYAPFVWTSVGACAIAMVIELIQLASRQRRAERSEQQWRDAP